MKVEENMRQFTNDIQTIYDFISEQKNDINKLYEYLENKQNRLNSYRARLQTYKPIKHLEQSKEKLTFWQKQLSQAIKQQLNSSQQHFALVAQKLHNISPLATLDRGYTITTDENGKALKTTKEAKKSKVLITRFADGEVRSKPE